LTGFSAKHFWNTMPPGSGWGYDLLVREDVIIDDAHAPGDVIMTLETSNYVEQATGEIRYGREEFEVTVDIEPAFLPHGDYWLEMHIQGPENCFIMCAGSPIMQSIGWVNYDDFGGLLSTYWMFGWHRSSTFVLKGEPLGTVQRHYPKQIKPLVFSGTPVGALLDIRDSDDAYYAVTAGQGVNLLRPQTVIVDFEAHVSDGSLQQIGALVEAHADQNSVRTSLSLYDFDASKWVEFDERKMWKNDDQAVVVVERIAPDRFRAPDGLVRLRAQMYAPGVQVLNFEASFDQVTFISSVAAGRSR
jgi:hypothetical protein